MKIICMLRDLLHAHPDAGAKPDRAGSAWLRDPLSHPAIERMSERELGDLPFAGYGRHGGCA